MPIEQKSESQSVKQAFEIAIRLGLVVLLGIFCLNILSPFISLVLWAAVIAVAMSVPFASMQAKLGGSKKLAITAFLAIGLGITLVPAIMFSESMFESATSIGSGIVEGTFEIQPPNDSVKDWPVIGERVHAEWSNASADLTAFLSTNRDMLTGFGKALASSAAGLAGGILQFAFAIIVAAVFLANSEVSNKGLRTLTHRLVGKSGDEFLVLSVATIRSVALGVLGIALIQAILGGLGMVVVGVPGAGLWALAILVVAVAQLPPWLILWPVAFYVFSVESSTMSVIFFIYATIVSFADMFLKPLLLGRGVEAPMLVILLGAIGGMLYLGIIGLFLGAVILALSYKLMMAWLDLYNAESNE
ncbi:MAG: putative PurR-regulated permease PerM [Pseudohongiellaceae bacterium]|jgi:predicted PurR-regulated permease PerM